MFRQMHKVFNEDIMKDIKNSGDVISVIEKEWETLTHDKEQLRQVSKFHFAGVLLRK